MNDYKIIREVGKGGMGCVYEALDSSNNKVALKMMSAKAAAHPDYREMFDHEVRSLRKLSHPSIVKNLSLTKEAIYFYQWNLLREKRSLKLYKQMELLMNKKPYLYL